MKVPASRARKRSQYEQFVDRVCGAAFNTAMGRTGMASGRVFLLLAAGVPGFKYDPALDWTTWTSWKKTDAESIGRGYNYPHVIAAYWSLYRLARNHRGLVTNHSWDWYRPGVPETARLCLGGQANGRRRVGYVELGLMEGDVIAALLEDLKREAWQEKAQVIEDLMKERTDRWGSRIRILSAARWRGIRPVRKKFTPVNILVTTIKRLRLIEFDHRVHACDAALGYNGNARRYWDFLYGGKIKRIERQLRLRIRAQCHSRPDTIESIRMTSICCGSVTVALGALSNIDQEGFASAAFHSFPATLKGSLQRRLWSKLLGHAFNIATYVINHPEFGWQTSGGNPQRERQLDQRSAARSVSQARLHRADWFVADS